MSLTPMDIHNKEFNTKMRGYDQDEVDGYLDRIVDAYGDALDKNVDLKNENVELKNEIKKLKEELSSYDKAKNSLNESLINAQEKAEEIIQKARTKSKKMLDEAQSSASSKAEDLKTQYTTLNNDYELLKGKVSDFRNQTKKLLQDQLKELDDGDWQYYLDKYYGRSRLYPADGRQPVMAEDKSEDSEQTQEPVAQQAFPETLKTSEPTPEVDKTPTNEVNSDQGVKDGQQILEGDSPVHEETKPSEQNIPNLNNGPMIIFPDDYKEHD